MTTGLPQRRTLPLTALAAAMACGAAHATISFEVTDLGAVPGTATAPWVAVGSHVTGLNNAGLVIGTYVNAANGEGAAFSWSPGAGVATPLPGLGFATFTGAINASGTAVGYGFGLPGDPSNHGVMWQHGAVTDLVSMGLPAGAVVTGIDDAGRMAGSLSDGGAFVWSAGLLTPLGTLGGSFVDVAGLNNAGQIAGTLESTAGGVPGAGRAAFLREASGTVTTLPGLPGATATYAYGLNNLGQVVGASDYGPVLWAPGAAPVALRAFVKPGASNFYLQSAYAINDLGQIAGAIGSDASPQGRGGVLTPTGTLNWTGAHGSAFNDGLNWDSGLGYAPSRLLDVVIAPDAAITVTSNADAHARSLTLGGVVPDLGWTYGKGTLAVGGGSTLVVEQAVTLVSGQLSVGAGSALRAGSLTQTGGVLTVDGTLDTYGGDVSISEGTLNGNGSINAGSFTVGGGPGFAFFRPGHSPGSFKVNGALTMADQGELELQVERAPDGLLAWDQVSASSITFLQGSRIHFVVGRGVAASEALSLNFLDCGSGCSFGAGVNVVIDGAPGATVSMGSGGLVLSIAAAQPVPEPSQGWLLLAGLMSGAALARRRADGLAKRDRGPADGPSALAGGRPTHR